MTRKNKTKEELIKDIKFLQKRIVEFEAADIKSKQAKEVLQENEERYRTLFEAMDEGFCVVEMIYDKEGKAVDYRFVEINKAFKKHTGLQHALGKTIRQMVPNHDAHWFEIYGKVAKTGEAIRFKNQAVAMQRYYDVFAFRIGGDRNQRVGILFTDITERKKIEDMLQKQQEEQQTILDSVPAGIFYKDKENRFIRVNKIFAEVMRMPKKQLEGKSLFDLYPKKHAEAYWRDDKEVIASGKAKKNIFEPLETRKGSVWLTDKIPYRDAQGDIIGVIGFTIDITERKKAETELKESREQLRILARHLQKDRETERARIARQLHDELGQILTAIKIDYAWLQKKLGLLQKSWKKEVKGLSGLIDITINMVRRLTMDLRPAMLDVLGLVPAIEWMIKGVQKRTGIKVKLTIKPYNLKLGSDLSLTVFRIIQEALTNVTRYARATRVQVMLEKKSGGLILTIKDNGIGIQQKQVKNPHSLGLIGMRERVMSHDGTLEITGEKGKGTTITVFLPPPPLKKGKNENTDR